MKNLAPIALLSVLLCLGLTPASAQQAQQAQPAAPAAARDIDPNTLANAALQALALVDGGRAGELWDGASAVAKRSVDRKKFVDTIAAQRKPLGAVSARRWTSVSRHSTAGNQQLPQGTYANVEFETRFAGNRTGLELVSLRQDEDGTWRLSGYVLK
ncbi:DUF4019 domain-containing protein [Lysobacter panacisoli]|nr:DUF4019 domain-containing protein [Lysobacter panacisoli]